MTMYVELPGKGPVQGIWCYPPDVDDVPNYLCDTAAEGLVITDLASLKRFFREKCRWSAEAVKLITRVVFLEQQTWQELSPQWPKCTGGTSGDQPKREFPQRSQG